MSRTADWQEEKRKHTTISMDISTPHHPMTIGRVEIDSMLPMSPGQRTLAGVRNDVDGILANSARRRVHAPTLLGSPARRGYSPRMAEIFDTARISIRGISTPPTRLPATSAERPTPLFHPRPVNQPNVNPILHVQSAEVEDGVPLYPLLPLEDTPSPARPDFMLPSPVLGVRNGRQTCLSSLVNLQEYGHERHSERLSPSPNSKKHSFFQKPVQIAQAQIVAMDEIETAQLKRDLSDSSASWTGDSQFYIPQHRTLPLPLQERRTSVPEWLEQLPVEPDEFEKDEQDENVPVALSPHVELERGSMRGKVRRQTRKRLISNASDEEMIDPCIDMRRVKRQ